MKRSKSDLINYRIQRAFERDEIEPIINSTEEFVIIIEKYIKSH